jgi:hypothetical protein
MAYSLKQLINPDLEGLLNEQQRDFVDRAVAEFFDHLKAEITQAISELQILENELAANPDYEISNPEQFTYHQYKLIRPVMLSFMEHMEKELQAAEDEGMREEKG